MEAQYIQSQVKRHQQAEGDRFGLDELGAGAASSYLEKTGNNDHVELTV